VHGKYETRVWLVSEILVPVILFFHSVIRTVRPCKEYVHIECVDIENISVLLST